MKPFKYVTRDIIFNQITATVSFLRCYFSKKIPVIVKLEHCWLMLSLNQDDVKINKVKLSCQWIIPNKHI